MALPLVWSGQSAEWVRTQIMGAAMVRAKKKGIVGIMGVWPTYYAACVSCDVDPDTDEDGFRAFFGNWCKKQNALPGSTVQYGAVTQKHPARVGPKSAKGLGKTASVVAVQETTEEQYAAIAADVFGD